MRDNEKVEVGGAGIYVAQLGLDANTYREAMQLIEANTSDGEEKYAKALNHHRECVSGSEILPLERDLLRDRVGFRDEAGLCWSWGRPRSPRSPDKLEPLDEN